MGGLLFDNAVYQAKLANRTATIAGVLWHQGEADTADRLSATYQERFEKIMNAFRKELNLYDVPFLVGGLGDFLADCIYTTDKSTRYNYRNVNAQLEKIAKENPMTGFVSAKGLTAREDNLHFNAKGLYDFGLRYFEAFEKLRDPNKVFVDKSANDSERTAMQAL